MRPTVSQYARSLEELSQGAMATEMPAIVKNFFDFLKRRGEEKKLDAVLAQLEKSLAEKEGRVTVTVVLAHEADEETKKHLSLQASKFFPQKEIDFRYVIDTQVIGGAIFRTDETLCDMTLSSELNSLKNLS